MKYDFADDLRSPEPSDHLHYKVMIILGVFLAILIAATFAGFAWAGA